MGRLNTYNTLILRTGNLLSLLNQVTNSVEDSRSFLEALGWALPPGVEDIGLTTINLTDTLEKLRILLDSTEEEWENDLLIASRIADLALASTELIAQIRDFAQDLPNTSLQGFDDYLDRTDIHLELPRRIFDSLLVSYLIEKAPLAFTVFKLFNLISVQAFENDEENFQVAHVRTIIHYPHFHALFSEPQQHFRDSYGWGTAQFNSVKLITAIADVLKVIGTSLILRPLDPRAEEALTGLPVPQTDAEPQPQLIINLYKEIGEIAGLTLGFSVFGARPTTPNAEDAGIGFLPIIKGEVETSIPFASYKDTFIDLSSEGDLLRQVALILRPGQSLEFLTAKNLNDTVTGRFSLGIRRGSTESERINLLSFPGGSGLQIQQLTIGGGMEKYSDGISESFMELGFLGNRFSYSLADADGFISESIPQEEVEATFDFRLGWTSLKGIYFQGSGGLEVAIPLHSEIGPFTLETLHLSLLTVEEGFQVTASTSGNLSLGPLVARVNEIGLKVSVAFDGGNLGLFGLSPNFKPPSGIGLTIDGGGFKGGGFLDFEPGQQRYSGMLELEYQNSISLKAIGLLTTQLPNGQPGYSLLIVITAEFSPVQLGFGFTLNGVGGLLGLNRTMNLERLRTGIRDNTLSSVLFPQNIVANADRIISDLRQIFPPQDNRFVFGPMARIGWGSPTIITIDLGLLIEVPNPIRLAILGIIKSKLPDEDASILRLQVNFLGVIDFEKKQLSFDASLYDSKLLAFTLTGDMAIRVYWGEKANFLLTVGGFHPAYQPPPMNLPNIRRLTLALMGGENPRLTLETYFAVTSNTVQFGAKAELYAAAWKFNVYGFISFDVLFQFSPFRFVADVSATLALRFGTSSFASIKLAFTLEGPTPWKTQGTASFKLCWFITIKVRFNKTFGENRNDILPAIQVLPQLIAALNNKDNWNGELPAKRHQLASFKETKATQAERVLAHPVGVLVISQKLAPLNIAIQKFGYQQVDGANEYRIDHVQLESQGAQAEPAREDFAPAQFFEFKDEEKLSSPSFEPLDSGIRIVEMDKVHTDYAAAREVKYELKYIDALSEQRLAEAKKLHSVDAVSFNSWALQGSVAQSELSFAKTGKSVLSPAEVSLPQENYGIVNTSDLRLFDAGSLLANEVEALLRRDLLIAENPALEGVLQVVPEFEINP